MPLERTFTKVSFTDERHLINTQVTKQNHI